VALATSCKLISGTSSCLINDVDIIFKWVRSSSVWEAMNSGQVLLAMFSLTWKLLTGVHRYYNVSLPLNVVRGMRPKTGPLKQHLNNLLGCLLLTQNREASDPRDKIFGLAGLVRIVIDIDYSLSTPQLYKEFSAYIANNTSDLINLLHHAGLYYSSSKLGLPSWVPDWSVPPSTCAKYKPFIGVYGANNNCKPEVASIAVSVEALSVKGIRLDTVYSTTPLKQDTVKSHEEVLASLSQDIQFLFQCDAQTILQDVLPNTPSS
jgi:hypothetical protein